MCPVARIKSPLLSLVFFVAMIEIASLTSGRSSPPLAQGFGKFAYFAPDKLPWIGADIRIGIAPLITVIITGLLCRAWLAHGTRNVSA